MPDSHAYTDSIPHFNGNGDSNANADINGHSNSNSYADFDAKTFTDVEARGAA
jgi:hypothetical protein